MISQIHQLEMQVLLEEDYLTRTKAASQMHFWVFSRRFTQVIFTKKRKLSRREPQLTC